MLVACPAAHLHDRRWHKPWPQSAGPSAIAEWPGWLPCGARGTGRLSRPRQSPHRCQKWLLECWGCSAGLSEAGTVACCPACCRAACGQAGGAERRLPWCPHPQLQARPATNEDVQTSVLRLHWVAQPASKPMRTSTDTKLCNQPVCASCSFALGCDCQDCALLVVCVDGRQITSATTALETRPHLYDLLLSPRVLALQILAALRRADMRAGTQLRPWAPSTSLL